MAFLADRIFDNGLSALAAEANALHICSAAPGSYAAVAGVSLGVKTGLVIGAPAAGDPDGRQVTVPAFADGAVNATGDASHYAIVDTVNLRLLATDALDAPVAVTAANQFELPAFDIRIPAAV